MVRAIFPTPCTCSWYIYGQRVQDAMASSRLFSSIAFTAIFVFVEKCGQMRASAHLKQIKLKTEPKNYAITITYYLFYLVVKELRAARYTRS